MSGMNAFFHIGSALGAVVLVYLLLRRRHEREFLLSLVKDLQPATKRVRVASPEAFLAEFADALGVAFESGAERGQPAKIDARPFLNLFLNPGINLIRCGDSGIEVTLPSGAQEADRFKPALEAALGGKISVTLRVATP